MIGFSSNQRIKNIVDEQTKEPFKDLQDRITSLETQIEKLAEQTLSWHKRSTQTVAELNSQLPMVLPNRWIAAGDRIHPYEDVQGVWVKRERSRPSPLRMMTSSPEDIEQLLASTWVVNVLIEGEYQRHSEYETEDEALGCSHDILRAIKQAQEAA